jgi:hypothetical protein
MPEGPPEMESKEEEKFPKYMSAQAYGVCPNGKIYPFLHPQQIVLVIHADENYYYGMIDWARKEKKTYRFPKSSTTRIGDILKRKLSGDRFFDESYLKNSD